MNRSLERAAPLLLLVLIVVVWQAVCSAFNGSAPADADHSHSLPVM